MANELTTERQQSLPEKLSVLPESWIDRIFGRMEASYGSLFLDRWRGCDIVEVKKVWAEELRSFSDYPACFGVALKAMVDDGLKFPPTLPEFVGMCRKAYSSPANPLMLSAPAPLSKEEAAERMREVKARFFSGKDAAAGEKDEP
jgi:hypothetical protein